MKRALPFIVILLSLALLIPGVTRPILSISGSIEKSVLTQTGLDLLAEGLSDTDARQSTRGLLGMFGGLLGLDSIRGEVEVFNKSRSIWGTVDELYTSGNGLVAALVMLFAILIPGLKLMLMLLGQLPLQQSFNAGLSRFTAAIGKWSMADVFVVALIVTYMAGNASAGMGEMLTTHARFEDGFYYFSAYCLFSVLSGLLLRSSSASDSSP